MLRDEIHKQKISPEWTNQFLEILEQKIQHGQLDKYAIIQSETFLNEIKEISEMISEIETYNHVVTVRDQLYEKFRYISNEEKKVIKCILNMLDDMINALVYFKTDKFKSIKEQIITMLQIAKE